ncbi:MAG: histidinol-phosphatase [Candidatus Latescibacterota bacterium]|nr:histidinol-phosphatase [Candidatus Latescibacterota bacterium]
MTVSPVLYEQHMHTPLCGHAQGEPEDYARVAHEHGLKGIVVTCHNPIDDGWSAGVRMSISDFDNYTVMVEAARLEWEGRVDVRLGLESDYYPGCEPWLEKLHVMAPLHHVLGSVHPQVTDYQQRYYNGSIEDYQRLYFEHLAQAAESGLFDTLAHPDLVKNSDPAGWDLDRVMDSVCASLDRIAATRTAMELNTSGLHKLVPEMNPGPRILAEMQQRGIPVVIGADAHVPNRVAADFVDALNELSTVGYTEVTNFLDRQRIDIPIETARASLSAAD